ncbi:Mur ligase family protein [Vreelandella alkaliphila]|uniref:Mur ligase family protein n=1 Tax=Vreelandella alkaliphila TaxID=272774 RepID=UPI003FD76508
MTVNRRSKIWTYRSLASELGLEVEPNDALASALVERVDIDGKYCRRGSLYIPRGSKTAKSALQNERDDIGKALSREASIVLTSLDRSLFPADAPVIQVNNLVEAAKKLAESARSRHQGKILGITGSVGKTTTKDMMNHALSYCGEVYATRGNYNEIDGVLMTLASMPEDAQYSLIEICSTKPRSIPNKAAHVRPHIGMVTVIGHSHGANYPSRYDILRDKVSMLDHLVGERIAILGRSVIDFDEANENLIAQKHIETLITVGQRKDDTVQLVGAELGALETKVRMLVDGKPISVRVPAAGRQFVDAAMFTMAGAHALGLDLLDIAENISTLERGPRRGERLKVKVQNSKKTVETIDDAQNSSPDSVRALLELVQLRNPKRKVLVFGDMLELGDDAPQMHESLAQDVLEAGIDVAILVGPLAALMAPMLKDKVEVHLIKTTDDLVKKVKGLVENGDLVVIKGSGGLQLERLLPALAPRSARQKVGNNWMIETEMGLPAPKTFKSIFATPQQAADVAVITDFEPLLCRIPLKKGFKTSRHTTKVSSNYILVMQLDGVVGLGEASPRSLALTGDSIALARKFYNQAREQLIGSHISKASPEESLADVRLIMQKLEKLALKLGEPTGNKRPFRASLAGIDIMLLDGVARLHNITVTELLGKQREPVGVSASTLSVPSEGGERLLKSIRGYLKRYPACRAKGAFDTDLNLEFLRGVTTVAGEMGQDKVAWLDMNEAYSPEGVPSLINAIVDSARAGDIRGTVILEQPVAKRFSAEMCEFQKLANDKTSGMDLDLVLMADESLWDKSDLSELHKHGGCDGINIKVQKCGGLLKALEIADCAKKFDPNVRIYIGGMIGTSDLTSRALLSLAQALPKFDLITSGPRSNIEAHIVTTPLKWVDHSNVLPAQDGTGLGLYLDWDTLRAYCEEDDQVRLDAIRAKIQESADKQTPTSTRVVVSGKVQGVGYLVWLQQEARARGVHGFVRNRSDGTVEAVLFCVQATLNELLALMRKGPEKAEVTELVTDTWTRGLKTNDFLRFKAVTV